MSGQYLKLDHNRFLPNPLRFIIHLSLFHSTLHCTNHLKVSSVNTLYVNNVTCRMYHAKRNPTTTTAGTMAERNRSRTNPVKRTRSTSWHSRRARQRLRTAYVYSPAQQPLYTLTLLFYLFSTVTIGLQQFS
jgi:hypothetical protein